MILSSTFGTRSVSISSGDLFIMPSTTYGLKLSFIGFLLVASVAHGLTFSKFCFTLSLCPTPDSMANLVFWIYMVQF